MISNIVVNYPDVESQFIPIHLTENKLLACTIDHILESQKHSLIHKGRASNIEGYVHMTIKIIINAEHKKKKEDKPMLKKRHEINAFIGDKRGLFES